MQGLAVFSRWSLRAALCLILSTTSLAVQLRNEDTAEITEENGRVTLRVDSPRPLAKAADALMTRFAIAINYEDPPFEYDDDLKDVCALVCKDFHLYAVDRTPKVLVPNANPLLIDLGERSTASAALDALVRLKNFDARGGTFEVVSGKELALHIVPRQLRNESGRLVPITPLLDHRITLPEKRWRDAELIAAICAALTKASGVEVVPGMGTPGFMGGLVDEAPPTYSFEARDEQARHVLVRALKTISPVIGPVAWRVFYGNAPQDGIYVLNLVVVPTVIQDQPILPEPQSLSEDEASPFSMSPNNSLERSRER